jgi:hypothetical protein
MSILDMLMQKLINVEILCEILCFPAVNMKIMVFWDVSHVVL